MPRRDGGASRFAGRIEPNPFWQLGRQTPRPKRLLRLASYGGVTASCTPAPFPRSSKQESPLTRSSIRSYLAGAAAGSVSRSRSVAVPARSAPPGHHRHAAHVPPPRQVGASREADPGRPHRCRGAAPSSARSMRPVGGDQVGAVEAAVDAEGLAEPAGTPAQVAVELAALAPPAGAPHGVQAGDGRGPGAGPPAALPPSAADDVGAPVHAVGEVDVEVAGRAEHERALRRGPAPIGVAARVVPPV